MKNKTLTMPEISHQNVNNGFQRTL